MLQNLNRVTGMVIRRRHEVRVQRLRDAELAEGQRDGDALQLLRRAGGHEPVVTDSAWRMPWIGTVVSHNRNPFAHREKSTPE